MLAHSIPLKHWDILRRTIVLALANTTLQKHWKPLRRTMILALANTTSQKHWKPCAEQWCWHPLWIRSFANSLWAITRINDLTTYVGISLEIVGFYWFLMVFHWQKHWKTLSRTMILAPPSRNVENLAQNNDSGPGQHHPPETLENLVNSFIR